MKKRKLTIVIWIVSMVVALGAGIFALTEECVHTGSWGEWETVKEATCTMEGLETRKCSRCREVEERKIQKAQHVLGTATITRQATCTEDGLKTTKCKVCGQVAKTETIRARGYHIYEEDFSERVNATCMDNGSKTLVCSTCGDVRTETIQAVGHHGWDGGIVNVDFKVVDELIPECKAGGATEGYTEHKVCLHCGEKNEDYEILQPVHGNVVEYAAVEMDCGANQEGREAGKQCTVCEAWLEGGTIIPVSHTYEGEWQEVVASTCTTKGKETQVCTVCHEEQFRALPLLNHEYNVSVPAKQPTCLENGWTRHMKCENCGKQDLNYQVIEKIGHTFDAFGRCGEVGCGVYTYEFIANGDGTYSLSKIIIGEGDTRNYFEIPATVPNTDYPVTGVLDYACEGLEVSQKFTIKLPESIKFIGASAFENCVKLVKVENLELVQTIGESAFEGCTALEEVKLDGVTTIGRTAFKDCTSLQEIVLPATVESVGYMAFRGCKKLVALTVAYIGGTATDTNEFGYIFGSNKDVPTSLTQVTVLTADKVYANAFAGAGAIQEIVLPTTVTAIEQNAFARCVSLSLVRFGENTNVNDFTQTTIGSKAFESVKFMEITLSEIVDDKLGYVFGGENETVPESLKTVTIVNATKIAPDTFKGSVYVEKIVLPDGVTAIGESAFNGCANLKEVVYDVKSVTEMGAMAFAGCDALETLTLPFVAGDRLGYVFGGENETVPESLQAVIIASGSKVAEKAFENCENIVYLTIPEVTEIGAEAFKGCASLKEIKYGETGEANVIPSTVLSIGQSAFEGCFKNGFTGYWDYTLGMYVQESVSLTLPFVGRDKDLNTDNKEDERIGYIFGTVSNASDMQMNVTKITILNESVIEKDAFLGCTYLQEIELKDTLTKISVGAFANCTSLKEIVVPDSVTEIGYRAFENCLALKEMTLPFVGKTKLAPSGSQHFGWVFGVDTSSKHDRESYKMPQAISVTLTSAEQILNSAFINYTGLTNIVIPSTVKILDAEAFKSCTNLETVEFVTVQNGAGEDVAWTLDKIGMGAFANCEKLGEIELPESVEVLDENAFLSCTALTRVVTQGNANDALVVREIGFAAFRFAFVSSTNSYPSYGSSYPSFGSTSVVIKLEGVETMNAKAFEGSNATEIYISNIPADTVNGTPARELKEIVEWTFFNCKQLTTLVLPNTVETIGNYAVSACEKLTAFRMPKAITSIAGYAFSDCFELTVLNDNNEEILEFNQGVWIGNSAFENCAELKEVAFNFELDTANPETVTIGMKAFAGCTNLEWVYLPYAVEITAGGVMETGVVSIGAKAFGNCGTDLYGNMYIFYNFDLTGEAWDVAWHEGANLGVTEDGEANKNLLELTDLNSDGKVDYEDYKLAKASAI